MLMAILRPLAYLSLPVFALRYLSQKSALARYYLKIVVYTSGLSLFSLYGVCISVFLALAGRRFDINFFTARPFGFTLGRILGIKLEIEGLEYLENRPAVLMANHQTMLDILYLGQVFPRRTVIMAKKELRWTPFLGQYMMLSGSVFVDRSNSKNAIASLKEAGETMKKQSTSLWIFPEGTRSQSEVPQMKPLKKGGFHLAVQSGIPIIPIVCENYWHLYRKGVFEEGTLKVKVLPPIPTTGLTSADVNDLALQVGKVMLDTLKDISGTVEEKKSPAIAETASIGITEIKREGREPVQVGVNEEARQRTPSAARSHTSTEDTEEEDGHVLVRRPS